MGRPRAGSRSQGSGNGEGSGHSLWQSRPSVEGEGTSFPERCPHVEVGHGASPPVARGRGAESAGWQPGGGAGQGSRGEGKPDETGESAWHAARYTAWRLSGRPSRVR
eukprot:scaffold18425_cov112-Isochrysis_galbana.AAC.5